MGPSNTKSDTNSAPPEGWHTLRRFLPYLWPKDRTDLRIRIVVAMVLVLIAKGATLALPYAYRAAVDAMETPANEAAMVAISFVAAYAAAHACVLPRRAITVLPGLSFCLAFLARLVALSA